MLKNLRALREEAGVTQKQLADAIGVSQQSINKYENHKIEPDIDTMVRISSFFHTSVDYLIGNTEVRRKIEVIHAFELNEEESKMLQAYRLLSDTKRHAVNLVIFSYND